MTLDTSWTTAAWFLPFILPIAIWVAWSDLAHMKIFNKAVLAQLVVFAVVGLIALPFGDYLWRYAHFGVALAIGFVMSALGMMGAGDAKYASAMAPFIALRDVGIFFVLLALMSILTFVLHRIARRSKLREWVPHWESWTNKKFPFGITLAPTLVTYLVLAFFTGQS